MICDHCGLLHTTALYSDVNNLALREWFLLLSQTQTTLILPRFPHISNRYSSPFPHVEAEECTRPFQISKVGVIAHPVKITHPVLRLATGSYLASHPVLGVSPKIKVSFPTVQIKHIKSQMKRQQILTVA